MKWISLLVCMALGLPCLMAGCAATDIAGLFFLKNDPLSGDRVVVGSLDAVAHSTHASLTRLGLKATASQVGNAIHIESETRSGNRFKLILTSMSTPQGERTRIKLQWVNTRDEQAGVQIMTELQKSTK